MIKKTKVIVVGLDGSTWNVIMPWMKEGKLPTFAKIEKKGCYGVLKSTIPPCIRTSMDIIYDRKKSRKSWYL